MRSSEETAELNAALALAQGEFQAVPKTAQNPFFKSSYADLPAVVLAASPILSKHGIAVCQLPDFDGTYDLLSTRVMHKSGQWIEASMRLHMAKQDPQAQGSAITYGRRYSYSGGTGIVTEADDDGNAASSQAPKTTRREPPRPKADLETGEVSNAISQAQLGKIGALFNDRGFSTDKAIRHSYVSVVIERDFGSTKELSKAEGSRVIEALMAEPPIPVDGPVDADDRPF